MTGARNLQWCICGAWQPASEQLVSIHFLILFQVLAHLCGLQQLKKLKHALNFRLAAFT